jgi:hypothetical protein
MLAIAAQFEPIARLLAVVAAVFPIEPAGLHRAFARRMRAFLEI